MRVAGVAVLVGFLMACGSTAQQSGSSGVGGNALDAPDAQSGGAVSAVPDGFSSDLSGGSSGSGAGPAAYSEEGVRPGAVAGPGRGRTGGTGILARTYRGVTARTITMGFEYSDNADAFNKAVGAETVSTGNQSGFWRILIDDINKHGGILGRQIKPVFHSYDGASTEPTSSLEQAACSKFTEDNEIFMLVGRHHTDNFRSCLARKGVLHVADGGLTPNDTDVFRRFPLYLEAGSLAIDTYARAVVPSLVRQDWFGRSPKIGLLTFDQPHFARASDRALKPALKAAGYTITDEVRVKHPEGNGDLGAQAAEVSSAVLRFASQGVDHVIFLEYSGDLAFFFMNSAESQGYRPRYAVSSNDGGQIIVPLVPEEQLKGARGIGWVPEIDVDAARDPGTWPARKRCLDLMTSNGQDFGGSRNASTVALVFCDDIWTAKAAIEGGGAQISNASVLRGYNALGIGTRLASTFASHFSPTRHDGVGAYRDLQWKEDCPCFVYAGPLRRI